MTPDKEFEAIQEVYMQLAALSPEQRERVMNYVNDKLATDAAGAAAATTAAAPKTRTKRTGAKPGPKPGSKPGPRKKATSMADAPSAAEALKSAKPKKMYEKALLAAAYLQEVEKVSVLKASAINKAFKEAYGKPVQNITQVLNRLVDNNPPFLKVSKDGDSNQARKMFTVTKEGVATAAGYFS